MYSTVIDTLLILCLTVQLHLFIYTKNRQF